MAEIEWTTYIEPLRHTLAEVTEENVLDFAREYGWVVQYVEKLCDTVDRIKVMTVSGIVGRADSAEVPFWVENTGRHARAASEPRADWKAES